MTLPSDASARPGATSDPTPAARMHWLVRIVERAGGTTAEPPDIPAELPAPEIWDRVGDAYGLSEVRLAELVARYFRLDLAELDAGDPNAALLLTEAMARKHQVFPLLQHQRHLVVATSDPTDVEAERALGFSTGRTPILQVAGPKAIQRAIDRRYASGAQAVEGVLSTLDPEESGDDILRAVQVVEAEEDPEAVSEADAVATPVARLTNVILRDGITAGASDIHIEPGRRSGIVRYRVDGILRKQMELPMVAMNRVISRIKIMAKLDIADRLRPQDGKARVQINGRFYDLRVSTLPAASAEKCVLRILDSSASLTLEDMNIPAPELTRLRSLLTNREGVIVVTGPTGSGKTSTLYSALRELADGRVNIMTVEDPIEYDLPAATQTQIEAKQGVTFASTLRAILRQDPDVILVGEIRDRETAETASRAAMTGHLVLTTVHANDAVRSVARLADLGLQHATIAQTLKGAIAQRLIRRVCPRCAEPVRGQLTPDEARLAEAFGMEPVVRAVGCEECGFSGYRGRLPVVEVLVAGPRFQEAIERRQGWAALLRIARQGGMRTMHQVALDWVAQGKATLVEVERVLGHIPEEQA